jgi:uncharacterized membrane protein (UPF0127 family)
MTRIAQAAFFCGTLLLAAAAGAGGLLTQPLEIDTKSGAHDFIVEIARTPDEQGTGLMYRRTLAPNAGMLFVYSDVGPVTMWMKNTLIPLDMVFIGPEGQITHIAERTVPLSHELIGSNGPVRAVLELNAGTASRLGIKVGDRVRHPAFQE